MRVSTERPMRARVVVAIVAGVVGASVLAGCGGDGPVSAAAPPAPPVVLPAAPEDVAKDLAGWAEAVGPIDYVTTKGAVVIVITTADPDLAALAVAALP